MLQLSVIIVNWNVRELLRACLLSVERELRDLTAAPGYSEQAAGSALPATAEIIVVDNASEDGSVEMVRREFPATRLLANASNVGFGAANNQAIAVSSGRFLLLLNPDTELRPGAIGRLVAFIEQRPQVACVGPRLLNPDGSIQPSRRAFPRLATSFVESTVLQRYFGHLHAVRDYYLAGRSEELPQPVDWLVGACLLVRRSALDVAGVFDERFFMYSEEMDLCYRMKRLGYEVWHVPEAEVVHYEAASSGQDLFRQNVNFHESRYRFFRKHGAGPGAEVLRWFTFSTYLFQIAEESAKFVLQPAKRPLRRSRIRISLKVALWYLFGS